MSSKNSNVSDRSIELLSQNARKRRTIVNKMLTQLAALPGDEIIVLSKLEKITADKINGTEYLKFVFESREILRKKGQNASTFFF